MDRISFGKKNGNRAGEVFCHLLDLALWLILLLAFWMALYQFQTYTRQEQKKSLIRALQKDIAVLCVRRHVPAQSRLLEKEIWTDV